MAEIVMGNVYTEILKPYLDENNMIPFEKAEALLLESNVDMRGCDAKDLFEDMENFFEYIKDENGDKVKCLKVNRVTAAAEKPVEEPGQAVEAKSAEKARPEDLEPVVVLDEKEMNLTNSKLVKAIQSLEREGTYEQGYVSMTSLGQKRASLGLSIPGNEKLKTYLMRFPDLFEVLTTEQGGFVRLANRTIPNTQPGAKVTAKATPAPKPEAQVAQTKTASVTKRYISLYQMSDFAIFPNYNEMKRQLAGMARLDGWFVLPDENEKDPYMLVDMKLRSNFAMAVHKQLQGEDAGFLIRLDSASFDTGFVTPEGAAIRAEFKLNQHRDSTVWQTWVFYGFSVVEA